MIRFESSSITQPNDNATATISSVFFLPPILPYSLLAQVYRPAPKASIIHSADPLSLFSSSFPSFPSLGCLPRIQGDRETVFARVCCMPVKEEVCVCKKRKVRAAPARRGGRSDSGDSSRRTEGRGRGAPREMPLRGFKNTRPALFAGPPTRVDETALSREP